MPAKYFCVAVVRVSEVVRVVEAFGVVEVNIVNEVIRLVGVDVEIH